MPGKSPYNAYRAFVEPLASALSCVARTKIYCSSGGERKLDTGHQLFLGGSDDVNGGYIKLQGGPDASRGIELKARMRYMLVKEAREGYGPYRATTTWYAYSVRFTDGQVIVDYHWHPDGNSDEVRPHIHVGASQLSPDAVISSKTHMLSGRATFESVIRTLIQEFAVTPLCDNWDDKLDEAERPHIQYRSWSSLPRN